MSRDELFFSVDVEASGPIPARYSMLSLGACVVGAIERQFYEELRPVTMEADPAALRVSQFSLDDLLKTGSEPATTMQRFVSWVEAESGAAAPVFVGFNAAFDWAFVNWYLHTYLGRNPFGAAPLDIKSFYMGLSGCSWDGTRSSQLPQRFRPDHQSRHQALDDAIVQAGIFERMLLDSRPPRTDLTKAES